LGQNTRKNLREARGFVALNSEKNVDSKNARGGARENAVNEQL
jgi:hypothetical protein